jgi:hypothetical protein
MVWTGLSGVAHNTVGAPFLAKAPLGSGGKADISQVPEPIS